MLTAAELIKKSRPQRSYNPVSKIRKTNQAKLDIQKKKSQNNCGHITQIKYTEAGVTIRSTTTLFWVSFHWKKKTQRHSKNTS